MAIIYITENNCECYGVTFENNGYVKVQKYKNISNDENSILCVNPLRTFLGKSQVSNLTMFSAAFDKSVFDGNTILPKISEENDRHKNVYIGGDMVCFFLTNDNIYEYISNMGNNLTPYSIAIGDEDFYFLTPHFKFIRRNKIDYDDLLSGYDPLDYHVSKCGKDYFEKLRLYKIHSNYD